MDSNEPQLTPPLVKRPRVTRERVEQIERRFAAKRADFLRSQGLPPHPADNSTPSQD